MISAVLAAVVVLAQGVSAPATTVAPDAAKPPSTVSPVTVQGPDKSAKADRTQVVCHKEAVLGSLFPKEVCATRQAFDERRQQDQQQVREWVALKPLKVN